MITSRTVLALAAAVSLGTGLTAYSPLAQAQSATSTGSMPTASAPVAATSASATTTAAKATPDAHVEATIKQLHSQLKITSAQEDQWKVVADDMRDSAHDLSSLIAARKASMNAVDNLKNYGDIAAAHADGVKKIEPDFAKLYDAMSATQKKTADNIFSQRVNQRVHGTTAPTKSSSAAPTQG